jgi:hypothetical protein
LLERCPIGLTAKIRIKSRTARWLVPTGVFRIRSVLVIHVTEGAPTSRMSPLLRQHLTSHLTA